MHSSFKHQLVLYGKRLAHEGFVIGSSGNISIKERRAIWIKASGSLLEYARPSDFVKISPHRLSVPLSENGLLPSIERHLHTAIYAQRPDVRAIIHAHPCYASVLACVQLKDPWDCITPDAALVIGTSLGRVGFYTPGSLTLAKAVGKAILTHNGLLLENHGALTVGSSLKEAFYRMKILEHSARLYMLSRLLAGNSSRIRFLDKRILLETIQKENATYRKRFLQ